MTNPGLIALKAIHGQLLSEEERAQLTPALLAQLAASGTLSLTRSERDRLSPALLAQLSVSGSVSLDPGEADRIPEVMRFIVEMAKANKT